MRTSLAKSFLLAVILLSNASRCVHASAGGSAYAELTRGQLIAAARAGGDYLIRVQKRDGSFHYYYDAAQDRFEARRYNIVRHAGTALSLLDLYGATYDRRYLESSRRAIAFLKSRLKSAKSEEGAYVLDYDGKAKLGANGLALAALAKQIELDKKIGNRKTAGRLANLILAMQRQDGSFESRYRLRTGDPEGTESFYYPGEAILGLVLFYKSNGDQRLLDCARRGANYLIESQRSAEALPPDAWLMQALEGLYNIGREKRYAEHSIALAEAMMADQYSDSAPAGYSGGFGPGSPLATPAAARAEGLAAAYRVARSTGDSRAAKIAASLRACASFQLAQQFSARNPASLPNARRAAGGFREGLTSMKIRIDFVQHNISSLIAIAKALY